MVTGIFSPFTVIANVEWFPKIDLHYLRNIWYFPRINN